MLIMKILKLHLLKDGGGFLIFKITSHDLFIYKILYYCGVYQVSFIIFQSQHYHLNLNIFGC